MDRNEKEVENKLFASDIALNSPSSEETVYENVEYLETSIGSSPNEDNILNQESNHITSLTPEQLTIQTSLDYTTLNTETNQSELTNSALEIQKQKSRKQAFKEITGLSSQITTQINPERDKTRKGNADENIATSLQSSEDSAEIAAVEPEEQSSPKGTRRISENLVESRDKLFMRKDNYVYFVDINGMPLDIGGKQLEELQLFPTFKKLIIGEANSLKKGKFYRIALPIQSEIPEGLTKITENIKTTLQTFRELVDRLQLASVSIAHSSSVAFVDWVVIQMHLKKIMSGSFTKVIICLGITQYPEHDQRLGLIKEAHESTLGGHKGVNKTYSRLRHDYYWGTLKLDIQKFIQQCLPCQLKKTVRIKTKNPMIITDTPGTAFEKISMDVVGLLRATRKNNEYILTIQDNLTKYSLAIPMNNTLAITIAEAFLKRFICVYGAPKGVLTDQGSNFLSDLMRRLAKRFRIKQFKTTAFHPQSNGSIERSHHTLGEYLKQYINDDEEWDEFLELATFSYNTSVHEGTRHTPYELVFGKLARIPSSEPLPSEERLTTYDDYLINLITRIHGLQSLAQINLINAKLRSKQYYDRNINPQNFAVGSFVFMHKGPKPRKLEDRHTGPHKVLDILGNGNVKIEVKGKPKVVHINRLRFSYIGRDKTVERVGMTHRKN